MSKESDIVIYKSASLSLPVATRFLHSCLQLAILVRSFLSPNIFSIHDNSASSSSGTKKDERSDKTVSKFAAAEVMLSSNRKDQLETVYKAERARALPR